MISAKIACAVMLAVTPTARLWADSNSRPSPGIQKERRSYVLGAIKELQGRADNVRRALEHMEAACQLVQRVQHEGVAQSTSSYCRHESMNAVRQEISFALSALNEARKEAKLNDFDRAERDLANALNRMSIARALLKI